MSRLEGRNVSATLLVAFREARSFYRLNPREFAAATSDMADHNNQMPT